MALLQCVAISSQPFSSYKLLGPLALGSRALCGLPCSLKEHSAFSCLMCVLPSWLSMFRTLVEKITCHPYIPVLLWRQGNLLPCQNGMDRKGAKISLLFMFRVTSMMQRWEGGMCMLQRTPVLLVLQIMFLPHS